MTWKYNCCIFRGCERIESGKGVANQLLSLVTVLVALATDTPAVIYLIKLINGKSFPGVQTQTSGGLNLISAVLYFVDSSTPSLFAASFPPFCCQPGLFILIQTELPLGDRFCVLSTCGVYKSGFNK